MDKVNSAIDLPVDLRPSAKRPLRFFGPVRRRTEGHPEHLSQGVPADAFLMVEWRLPATCDEPLRHSPVCDVSSLNDRAELLPGLALPDTLGVDTAIQDSINTREGSFAMLSYYGQEGL
jgi:hypothetical protein